MLHLLFREYRLLRLILRHHPPDARWGLGIRIARSLATGSTWVSLRSTLLAEVARKQGLSLLRSRLRGIERSGGQDLPAKASRADAVIFLCLGSVSPRLLALIERWRNDIGDWVRIETINQPDFGLETLRARIGDARSAIVLNQALLGPDGIERMLEAASRSAGVVFCNELILDDTGRVVDALIKPSYSKLSIAGVDYLSPCYAFESRMLDLLTESLVAQSEMSIAIALAAQADSVTLVSEIFCSSWMAGMLRAPYERPLQRAIAHAPVPDGSLVSVIIPTRDRWDLLEPCLASLEADAGRIELEFLVVDNGSTDIATCSALEGWVAERSNRHLLRDDSSFNWSRLNNLAVRSARGDALLFLNNDTEVLSPGGVETLYRALQIQDVGICGARLMYPDHSVQHAGVVFGFGGSADHIYRGCTLPIDFSPFFSPLLSREVSAVTGAALMVRSSVFEQLGGYDETYEVTGSDIDLCIRAGILGLKTLYCAEAVWIHHESKSRRNQNPRSDIARLARRISQAGLFPDPHYSALLSMHSLYPLVDIPMELNVIYSH